MDVVLPQVPLLRPTTQKEFIDLIEALHVSRTQDVTKRWLDYLGREENALIQILIPKAMEDIKDINYIRGIIEGFDRSIAWWMKLVKKRNGQIEDEAKADKKKKEEAKKKNALVKKQAKRKAALKDMKLKGGKTDG